jgi:hypothetical protein
MIGWGRHQEEVGIEALGHEHGCDPVGEGSQQVTGQLQSLALHQLAHGDFARVQRAAMPVLDLGEPLRAHQLAAPPIPGQQHPALLEGLADGGHPHRQRGVIHPLAAPTALTQPVSLVAWIDLAAGKDHGRSGEVDLVVTLHHEHLEVGGPIAHQQDGG